MAAKAEKLFRPLLFQSPFPELPQKARRSTALWQPGATLAANPDAEQA
jgi:hypothetical protein